MEGPRVKFLISEHLENQTLYEMEQHCLFNNFHFFAKVSLEVQSFHKGLKNHFVILLEAFQSLLDSGLFCLLAELLVLVLFVFRLVMARASQKFSSNFIALAWSVMCY